MINIPVKIALAVAHTCTSHRYFELQVGRQFNQTIVSMTQSYDTGVTGNLITQQFFCYHNQLPCRRTAREHTRIDQSTQPMVTEAEAFCLSCGVARNRGSNCDYCGRMYVDAAKSNAKPKQHRALAPKYSISKKNNETVISWRWKNRSTWFLLVVALFWMGIALSMGGELFLTNPRATFPIPLLPVLVGLFLLAQAIVKLTNKPSIHASRQSLSIRHYPLPWRKNIRYSKSEISQLFVTTVERRDEHRTWKAPVLQLATTSGVRHAILSGYNESQFADFETLKHEIQSALGIDDNA